MANVYGVLDCAVDPQLHEHAERLQPHFSECLFAGRLNPQLLQVSPYVVELAPSDPLSKLWRSQGWGKNWGILIASSESLPYVRRRLRHFTQAKLPSGEGPVLFRFWDPRVFRIYMPLVEPDQLAPWFQGIERYIVETEDGAGSLRYSLSGGKLSVQQGPAPAR